MWIDDPATKRQKLCPKWTGPYKVVPSNDKGIIYRLLDLNHPHKEPKVIHYDRLKPFRGTWEALGEHTPLPRYTALSGSLLLNLGSSDTSQTAPATGPIVPLMRRPSGRLLPEPQQQAQGTEPGVVGPGRTQLDATCTTRSGRTVRRTQRLLL